MTNYFNKKPTLLIIAMPDSIHTVRWIGQILDQSWDIHLFPSYAGIIHEDIKNIHIHDCLRGRFGKFLLSLSPLLLSFMLKVVMSIRLRIIKRFFPHYRTFLLNRVIKKIKPDLLHTLETQSAGYLVLDLLETYHTKLPIWIHSLWGSDLYLFHRIEKHKKNIIELLCCCDYLICEGQRDVDLAKKLGFSGINYFTHIPTAGGIKIKECTRIGTNSSSPSKRVVIMLKGYDGWAGRALVALRALEIISESLRNYEIVIYSGSENVALAVELFTYGTGVSVTMLPPNTKHGDILSLLSKARISIGLSISDGLPNALLEAMAMGAFPIQSWTSMANEWIIDGVNGILVHPEDPEQVSAAIKKALSDDKLVDNAAMINLEIIRNNFEYKKIKNKAIEVYTKAFENSKTTKHKK